MVIGARMADVQKQLDLDRRHGKRPGSPAAYCNTCPNGFDDPEGPSALQEAIG